MKKISSREFFTSLHFVDPYSTYHSIIELNSDNVGFPIFTTQELTNEPLKWLKHILLAHLGLRPVEKLHHDIKRYAVRHWEAAKQCCIDLLEIAQQNRENILIVMKLVPMNKAGQLPNFRISQIEEVESIFSLARTKQQQSHSEIWLCKSKVSVGSLSFSGRLCLPGKDFFGPSLLEMVWYTSPRFLESINLATFEYPYLMADRPVGKLSYHIKTLFIPTVYRLQGMDDTKFVKEFQWLCKQFEAYQEKIETLKAIVFAAGANELSLEFLSDDGYFQFIDWDTEVEVAEWLKTP